MHEIDYTFLFLFSPPPHPLLFSPQSNLEELGVGGGGMHYTNLV